jgi:hypothetical protein
MESCEEDWAEDEARRFVGAVTRLAAPSPVVFCFDQIEALGLSHEKSNYGFFCQMGASLVDTTQNSLLISTINLDFLAELKSGSRDADFQRISKDQFDLQPLDLNLGRQLVNARLALVPGATGAIDEVDLRANDYGANPGRPGADRDRRGAGAWLADSTATARKRHQGKTVKTYQLGRGQR